MKRVFIIDVPDWWNQNTGMADLNFYDEDRSVEITNSEFTEFTPPTDEEIEAKALEISRKYGIEGNAGATEMANYLKGLMK